jgi:hypothetical protein
MKDGLSQVIINLEVQKDDPTKYKIINRATFYVCRLVSSQKERDFKGQNYDDIKQVFSIWICLNMKENSMMHYHMTKDAIVGNETWKGNEEIINIVMLGIAKELPEHTEEYELHRLIGALLSQELTEGEKLNIIENEYDIPVNSDIREGLQSPVDFGFKRTGAEAESELYVQFKSGNCRTNNRESDKGSDKKSDKGSDKESN